MAPLGKGLLDRSSLSCLLNFFEATHSHPFLFRITIFFPIVAAVPTVSNQNVSTDAFHNTSVMLMCPIPLPTVRSSYTLIWEQLMDSTPIPLMNDSDSGRYILSHNSRTLSILIHFTDQRVFRCMLNIQRCSPIRCQEFDVEGPFMEINVLSKLMIHACTYEINTS